MTTAYQLDIMGGSTPVELPDREAQATPELVESIGPDILYEYHQASSLLWIVTATHEPTGRQARTTVGDVPVDEITLAKLAASARRTS